MKTLRSTNPPTDKQAKKIVVFKDWIVLGDVLEEDDRIIITDCCIIKETFNLASIALEGPAPHDSLERCPPLVVYKSSITVIMETNISSNLEKNK